MRGGGNSFLNFDLMKNSHTETSEAQGHCTWSLLKMPHLIAFVDFHVSKVQRYKCLYIITSKYLRGMVMEKIIKMDVGTT